MKQKWKVYWTNLTGGDKVNCIRLSDRMISSDRTVDLNDHWTVGEVVYALKAADLLFEDIATNTLLCEDHDNEIRVVNKHTNKNIIRLYKQETNETTSGLTVTLTHDEAELLRGVCVGRILQTSNTPGATMKERSETLDFLNTLIKKLLVDADA